MLFRDRQKILSVSRVKDLPLGNLNSDTSTEFLTILLNSTLAGAYHPVHWFFCEI